MGVVAPWCLGVGLVISMAADAGQDATIGASLAPASFRAVTQPGDLIPTDVTGLGFGVDRSEDAQPQEARLLIGELERIRQDARRGGAARRDETQRSGLSRHRPNP